MSRKTKDFVEFSVRVPEWLDAELEGDASRAVRSKNGQVNMILIDYFERKQKRAAAGSAGKAAAGSARGKAAGRGA